MVSGQASGLRRTSGVTTTTTSTSSSSKTPTPSKAVDVGLLTPIGQDAAGNFIYKPEDEAVIGQIKTSGGCVDSIKGTVDLVPCEERGAGAAAAAAANARPYKTKTECLFQKRTILVATVILLMIVILVVVVISRSGSDAEGSSPSPPLSSSSPTSSQPFFQFCGETLVEADRECAVQCPTGQDSECPTGQRCFHVVSCDAGDDKKTATALPTPAPTFENSPKCQDHPACAEMGLTEDCCPTSPTGAVLDCCTRRVSTFCRDHPLCVGLAGECCPTVDDVFLDCCDAVAPPETAFCDVHPKCAALNLADVCCPTRDGVYLDCCS